MSVKLFYIKDKKLFYVKNGKSEPVPDGVYEGYLRRVTDNAKRNEWKNSGSGAKFTGTYSPGEDAASVASSVQSDISCVGKCNDKLIFSERIGDMCAIYRKNSVSDMSEIVAFSDTSYSLDTFDAIDDRIAISASYANLSHIATASIDGRGGVDILTEGESYDQNPSFDRSDPNVLYYESAGVLLSDDDDLPNDPAMAFSPSEIMRQIQRSTTRGPSAIVRLNFATNSLDYVLEDDKTSYVKPSTDIDGNLYFIRRPYKLDENKGEGCLVSLVMVPVRFFKALGGFFNFFSMKYSGQPLTNGQSKAKRKDERQIFIDGNLIDAERSLKENSNEKYPGVIPKSFELCRLFCGNIEKIKSGVIAYTFDPDGLVVYSNGSSIVRIGKDGREELLVNDGSAHEVTFLKFIDIDD